MVRLKLFGLFMALFGVLVPFFISLAGALSGMYVLYIVALITVFAAIRFLPFARGYENIWAFVVSALATIPINIGIIVHLAHIGYSAGVGMVADIILFTIYFSIFFSVEEVIIGLIARRIWKKQKNLFETKKG